MRDDSIDIPMPGHHFLVMSVALGWSPCLHLPTHLEVYLFLFSLSPAQVKETAGLHKKFDISLVLNCSPVVFGLFVWLGRLILRIGIIFALL